MGFLNSWVCFNGMKLYFDFPPQVVVGHVTIRRPTSSFSYSSSSDVLLSSSDVKEMARKITTWRRSEGGKGGRGRGGGGGVGGSGGSGTKSIVEVVVEEIDPTSMGGGGGRGAGGGVTGASTFTLIQRITKRLDSRKVKTASI